MLTALALLIAALPHPINVDKKSEMDIRVHYLSVEEGLSSSQINSLFSDEFGFLWIATEYGLNRFDGITVEQIPVPVSTISNLCGDRNGHIFFKSRESLWSLDLKTMKCDCIFRDNIVYVTFRDRLIWATSQSVFVEAAGKPEIVYSVDPAAGESILAVEVDGSGSLFIALATEKVLIVKNGEILDWFRFDGLFNFSVDDSSIWVNSRNSGTIRVLPTGERVQYRFPSSVGQDGNNVRCVVRKATSEYYVGTYEGLYVLNVAENSFVRLNYQPSLAGFHNQAVRTLLFDSGTLYIGTYHAGVHCWNPGAEVFSPLGLKNKGNGDPFSPVVSAIVEDRRGALWIGSVSGGLRVIEKNPSIKPGFVTKILSDPILENIKSLYYDEADDALWVGLFSEGIYRIGLSEYTIEHIKSSLYSENITRIAKLDDRHILACSVNGLMLIDIHGKEVLKLVRLPFSISFPFDFCVEGDDIWVLSKHAVYRFNSIDDMGEYECFLLSDIAGLGQECIFTTIYRSRDGVLFFCSNGSGLFYYDRRSGVIQKAGNMDGCVNNVTEGPSAGVLYAAMNTGIATMETDTKEVQTYGKPEGYPLAIVNNVFVSSDSIVYACCANGIKTALEKNITTRVLDYELFFKDIYLEGERLRPSESGALSINPLYSTEITVRGPIKSISFDVFNSSRNPVLSTAYEYCLIGFDADYQYARSRSVTYTNLKRGKYVFSVKGTVPNTKGQYPARSVKLTVKPPFLLSAGFISAYSVLFLVVVVFFAVLYARSVRFRMLLEVERQDKIRRQQVSDAKTVFMTNVSHEFRTPLTLINSNLESLLSGDQIPSEGKNKVRNALRNTGVLNRMVDEFIDYNKMSSGDYNMEMHPVDMNEFLGVVYAQFLDLAHNRRVRFDWSPSIKPVVCEIDETWVYRAVGNIITNAFKYTSDFVGVSLHASGQVAVIVIEDNGVGIKEENLERIFERFYRENETNLKLKTKGSGIGLALARRVFEMHSGLITAEKRRNGGTAFRVELPLSSKTPESLSVSGISMIEEEKPAIANVPQTEHVYSGGKILIVEDNDEMRMVLVDIFSSKYDVILAMDGEMGLRMAERKLPDLIVSDVMMPNMSGLEMCEKLKSMPETSHIPIILLTALNTEKDALRGLAGGADDYVSKPFSASLLLAKVETVLRNRRAVYKSFSTGNLAPEVDSGNAIDAKILKNAVRLIEENLNNQDFDILEFAKGVGLSRSVLFNKIKSLTGLTPNEFITSIKLKKAAEMLSSDIEETTASIAYACGFNTPSYFIKCFRRFYGVTPLHYRKNK